MIRNRAAQTALLAMVIAATGWLDFVTGVRIGLSLLYLIPIMIAGWRLGRVPAVGLASLAALSWLLAELGMRTAEETPFVFWNWVTRVVIYVAFAVLVGELRRDREQLSDLNRRLQGALDREVLRGRTDSLTGLLNSTTFLEELNVAIAQARDGGEALGVAYIDIDNFKELNDHYGHLQGDAALRKIAESISVSIRTAPDRSPDRAGRLGGDEFALILTRATREGVRIVGERIVQKVAELGQSEYPEARLGASVGAVISTAEGRSSVELLGTADRLMYRSKAEGKGMVVVEELPPRAAE